MPDNLQQESLTKEQKDRLWQRYMSEETIFNNRLNFFLVIESVLIGATVTIFGQTTLGQYGNFILKLAIFLGLSLTIVWTYVSAKQKWVLEIVRNRTYDQLPEFRATAEEIKRGWWPLKIRFLLAHVVPAFFLIIWVILFYKT